MFIIVKKCIFQANQNAANNNDDLNSDKDSKIGGGAFEDSDTLALVGTQDVGTQSMVATQTNTDDFTSFLDSIQIGWTTTSDAAEKETQTDTGFLLARVIYKGKKYIKVMQQLLEHGVARRKSSLTGGVQAVGQRMGSKTQSSIVAWGNQKADHRMLL